MPANPKIRVEITAIDRATAVVKNVGNQLNNLSSTLMKLAGGYAAIRMGFAAFEQLTTKVAEYGEQLLIGAQRTGMTTEQIAGLGLMAKQKGLDFDALLKPLGFLSRNLAGFSDKGKDATRALQALGVDSRDATGKLLPMHDLLLRLADRFASMPAGPQKAAAAMAIFGKSGAALIPFLNEGAAGIQELEKCAAELGIALDEKSARAAHELGDQMVILGEMVHGLTLKIGIGMLPTLLQWTVALESIGLKLKEWKFRLEAAYYAVAAVGAALSLHWDKAKGLWGLAIDASNDATNAEIAYEAAISKGTGELDRRIKTINALGDLPDAGTPKEDKDAKRRLAEITKAFHEAQEAAAAYNKHLASIVDALRESWDPTIKAAERMEELNQAFARGMISGDEFSRGIAEIQAELANLSPTIIAQHQALLQAEEAATRYSEGLDSIARSLKESLQTAAQKATASFQQLTVLLGTGRISAQEFSLATQKIQADLGKATPLAQQFANTITSGLTDMIVYGRGGIQMLQSLIAMLVEATLRAILFGESFQGTGQGSGTGLLGQGISALISAIASHFGGRQAGAAERGRAYVVGEAGPEVFVPETAGEILPHRYLGALTGRLTRLLAAGLPARQAGGPVVPGFPYLVGEAGPEPFIPSFATSLITNRQISGDTYIIDARGADPTVDMRLRRMLRELHGSAVETARRQRREEMLRSGG